MPVILKLTPPSNKRRGIQCSKCGNSTYADLALIPMTVVLKSVVAPNVMRVPKPTLSDQ